MGKKRVDRSKAGPVDEAAAPSPFAALAGLRDQLPEGAPADEPPSPQRESASEGASTAKAVVRRERAGRGGKTVTLIEQLALPDEALKALAKKMKKAMGCGATVEDSAIVLQGDLAAHRDDVVRALKERQIGCSIYYPRAIPCMTHYREHRGTGPETAPIADAISRTSIALPVGPHLGEGDMRLVAHHVTEVIQSWIS